MLGTGLDLGKLHCVLCVRVGVGVSVGRGGREEGEERNGSMDKREMKADVNLSFFF